MRCKEDTKVISFGGFSNSFEWKPMSFAQNLDGCFSMYGAEQG